MKKKPKDAMGAKWKELKGRPTQRILVKHVSGGIGSLGKLPDGRVSLVPP